MPSYRKRTHHYTVWHKLLWIDFCISAMYEMNSEQLNMFHGEDCQEPLGLRTSCSGEVTKKIYFFFFKYFWSNPGTNSLLFTILHKNGK
ncbi:hypothetical protein GDO78_006421 [Eleutherodactylus coqui]|uniref:Uncharacterized protein n=1 Tax=Eleutherodactylus coqui TaxID=57060 RepID=A0A8J6FN93_ELECQ|nr:hypothetical protein GDO78_006421 [Eleutherodactylus coqui]